MRSAAEDRFAAVIRVLMHPIFRDFAAAIALTLFAVGLPCALVALRVNFLGY